MMRTFVRLMACLGLAAFAAFASDAILSGDSYITTANPSANFGAQATMFVGGGATALVEFNFSSLPPGLTSANISKATLRLYVNRVTTAGNITVHTLGSTFPEATVTYSGFSSFIGSDFTGNIAVGASQVSNFVVVDVTTQVQAALSLGNVGFAIVGDGTVLAQFDTKESTTSSHPAVLDVVVTSFGPEGATGPQGPAGPTGATGPQGPAGAIGPPGSTGANGNTVLNGIGAPASSLGNNGDFYLNKTNNCLYGPKASGVWPGICTSLVGPTGATGATGATGSPGLNGAPGAQGPTGPTGPAGPHARIINPNSQTFTSGTFIEVNLTNVVFNNGANTATANQIGINTTGTYIVTAEILWAANGSGLRAIAVNTTRLGEIVSDSRPAVNGYDTLVTASTVCHLSAGDSVTMAAIQTTGANLGTHPFNGRGAALSVAWIAP